MKKLSIIAAGLLSLGCLCAEEAKEASTWLSNVSGKAQVKFETEHATRGRKDMQQAFAPKVKFVYDFSDAMKIYTGVDTALALKSDEIKDNNQVKPFIGLTYDVTDMFTLDAGYIHHFYTNKEPDAGTLGFKRNSNEIYAGVLADVILTPAMYVYYDCNHKEFAIEGTVGYNFDLSEYSISGLGLELGAKLGYDHMGEKDYRKNFKIDSGYIYYGVNADLAYGLNNVATAKVGVAYEGNNGDKESWINQSNVKNMVWFNASVDCAF